MFTAGSLGVAALVILIGCGAKGLSLTTGLFWPRKDRYKMTDVKNVSLLGLW